MTLWFMGGLFALALLDLWMRRGRADEASDSLDSKTDDGLSFLLRPLVPGYRFFDRIETGLQLRMRVLDSADVAGPWLSEPAPPKRPWYFWCHNPDENLWLAEQASLPGVLGDERGQTSAFALLSARCALQMSQGQRFQFAIFAADGQGDAPLFVSPVQVASL